MKCHIEADLVLKFLESIITRESPKMTNPVIAELETNIYCLIPNILEASHESKSSRIPVPPIELNQGHLFRIMRFLKLATNVASRMLFRGA